MTCFSVPFGVSFLLSTTEIYSFHLPVFFKTNKCDLELYVNQFLNSFKGGVRTPRRDSKFLSHDISIELFLKFFELIST